MKINTIEEAEYDKENLYSLISWIQIGETDMSFEYIMNSFWVPLPLWNIKARALLGEQLT